MCLVVFSGVYCPWWACCICLPFSVPSYRTPIAAGSGRPPLAGTSCTCKHPSILYYVRPIVTTVHATTRKIKDSAPPPNPRDATVVSFPHPRLMDVRTVLLWPSGSKNKNGKRNSSTHVRTSGRVSRAVGVGGRGRPGVGFEGVESAAFRNAWQGLLVGRRPVRPLDDKPRSHRGATARVGTCTTRG